MSSARPRSGVTSRGTATLTALGLVAGSLAIVVVPPAAHAADFTITTTADVIATDGACSLREAIINSNNDNQSGSTDCPAGGAVDNITVPPGTYTLTGTGGDDLSLSGDLDLRSSMRLIGAGADQTIIQAGTDATNGIDRVIDIPPSGVHTIIISGVTLRYGRTADGGGGQGGGLFSNSASDVYITDSAIVSNHGGASGGGLYAGNGTMTILRSEISGNSAYWDGGGIQSGADILNLVNSTVSANTAVTAPNGGGGILTNISSPQIFRIRNSTIAGNHINAGGGAGVRSFFAGTIDMANSIITGNTGGNEAECGLNAPTVSNNLADDATCGAAANPVTGFDGTLSTNGGPTRTHRLLSGSNAIDTGTGGCIDESGTALTTDQRGFVRPVGVCDIGAFESPVIFLVTNTADSGAGSLRQALLDANAHPNGSSVDVIEFDIAGAGPHAIAPLATLPSITEAVTIDGYSQPGASANTLAVGSDAVLMIELVGSADPQGAQAGSDQFGLFIGQTGSGTTVRGLVINGFNDSYWGAGIYVQYAEDVVVEGNFVGTNAAGTAAVPNRLGVAMVDVAPTGTPHRVGGTTPPQRNVVSGNVMYGVWASQWGGGMPNLIQGNYIGTNAAGTASVGNYVGVRVDVQAGPVVGGVVPGAGNLISGNAIGIQAQENLAGGHITQILGNLVGTDATGLLPLPNTFGIELNPWGVPPPGNPPVQIGDGTSVGRNVIAANLNSGIYVTVVPVSIRGNYIGVGIDGTTALGNGGTGITLLGSGNQVGDPDVDEGNVIAHNGGAGVFVGTGYIENRITRNSLSNNGGAGIDLLLNGNLGQDAPQLTQVLNVGYDLEVDFAVADSAPLSTYPLTIEFFVADDDVSAEGMTYLGSATVASAGAGSLTLVEAGGPSAVGNPIVATATDADGNTSEFSAVTPVVEIDGALVVDDAGDAVDAAPGDGTCATTASACTLRAAIEEANALAGADTIVFSIPGAGVHTIVPASALPYITGPVTIDGSTQAGATCAAWPPTLTIEIDFTNAGAFGLVLQTGASTVRGLVLNRVSQTAIGVGSSANTFQCNFFGTNPSGAPLPGTIEGIWAYFASAGSNTIGGSAPGQGNLFASHGLNDGVFLTSEGNVVQGNHFNVALDGTPHAVCCLGGAVILTGSNNVVGGTGPGEGNVLGAYGGDGVTVAASAVGNTIRGNSHVRAACGGCPTGLGIDLSPSFVGGVTANDVDDADSGPNNLQNFPSIGVAEASGAPGDRDLLVVGNLDSTPYGTYDVDVYSAATCHATGYGEGQVYLGSFVVAADATGYGSFVHTFTNLDITDGWIVTATATDQATGDTSEFSACRTVVASADPPDIENFAYDVKDDSGTPGITQVGVGAVPIRDIPIEAIVGANGAGYQSAPLGSIPLGSIPLGSIDLDASPLGSIPLGSIPLGSIDLQGSPLGSIPLGSIPLGSIAGGWGTVLAGTVLAGIPLQRVTLGDVLALDPAPAGLAGISLADVSLQDSPLGSIGLPAVALGDQKLLDIDPTLCDAIAPIDCNDPATDSLIELQLASAPLGSIPLGSIPLGSIPLGSIPLGSIPLGSIPLGSIPLGSIPLGSIPLGSIDLLGAPLGSIPLGSIPLGSIPLGSIDLHGAPLGSIPLGSILLGSVGGCASLSGPYDCLSLGVSNNSTLADFAAALPPGLTFAASPLGSIPLGSIPLGSIPLGSIPLGSIPLGSIDVDSAALAQSPLGSIPLGSIGEFGGCGLLDATAFDCVSLVVSDTSTLSDFVAALEALGTPARIADTPLGSIPLGSIPLGSIPLGSIDLQTVEVNGVPLGSIPLGSIGLNGQGLASTPLGSIPLGSIALNASPLGSIPLGSIPLGSISALVDCSLVNCATATLALAQAAGAVRAAATLGQLGEYGATTVGDLGAAYGSVIFGVMTLEQLTDQLTMELLYGDRTLGDARNDYGDLSFGQLLISMMLQSDFPWETLPLKDMGLQAIAPTGTVTYTVSFDLTGAGAGQTGVVTARVPGAFLYQPGSAILLTDGVRTPLPDPYLQAAGGEIELTFDLTLDAGHAYDVEFEAVPGFDLATLTTSADALFMGIVDDDIDDATITVQEYFTGNNSIDDAASIPSDTLVFSHTSTARVSDYFEFTPGPVGTRNVVFVSQFDTDTDLVLYKPASREVSAIPTRSVPLDGVPVDDTGIDYAGTGTQEPELQGDIDVQSAPIGGISINRGTTAESAESTTSAAALSPTDPYVIQVSPYQGKASANPYVVRVKRERVIDAPACPAAPFTHGGAAGIDLGGLPAGLNTLFLFNVERFAQQYGATAAANVEAAIEALIADGANGVVGAILPVEEDPGVQGAYAAWDAQPCSPDRANDVVTAITSLIGAIQSTRKSLAYVTVIGNDDMVPFARLDDLTSISNESTFTEQFASGALLGSLETRHFLSDDPYGDLDPIRWLDRRLHLPELAVGRLVEAPEDIVGALNNFVSFDGRLDPQTADVAGYDFLADGSTVILDRLTNIYGAAFVRGLIDVSGKSRFDTWTRQQLLDFLDLSDATPASTIADIVSVNAHSDQFRQLPSFGDANKNESDVFSVADLGGVGVNGLAGKLVFTMGCHAGLSVSDIGVVTANPTDWAQTYSRLGALYVGNSGYGYGDTVGVALSERLMAEFAENLDGAMTVGQAMAFAKQEYFAQLGQYGPYDEKSMQQVIFYGLPMYKVGATPPVTPPDPLPTALYPRVDLQAATISFAPTYQTVTTPGIGTYLAIDGQTQNTQYRPIQPLDTVDISQDDLLAHGAIVTSATTTDVGGVDPVYFRPNVTGSAEVEPEVPGDEIATEVFDTAVSTYNAPGTGPAGEPFVQRQQVSIVAGSFRSPPDGSEIGVQRRIDAATIRVLYAAPSSTDFEAPPVTSVASVATGGQVSFTVTTTATDVAAVLVLYRHDVSGGVSHWVSTVLVADAGVPGSYSGGGPVDASAVVDGGVDYKVWIIDTSGNVSTSDNKNLFWDALPPAPPVPADGFDLEMPAPEVGVWHTGPVTVSLVGEPGVVYTVEGGLPAIIVGSGAFEVSGEGFHEVVVTGGGETSTLVILIDSTDPTVDIVSPDDGEILAPFSTHIVEFECLDAGSGIAAGGCTATLDGVPVDNGDPIDTSIPGTSVLVVNVVDDVGNTASASAEIFVLADDVAPEIVSTPTSVPNAAGWWKTPVTFSFTCSDDSGVATCPSPVPLNTSGAGQSFTVSAVDIAGNVAELTVSGIDIDLTPPSVVVTAPATVTPSDTVDITCSASDGLSGIATSDCSDDTFPATDLAPGANLFTFSATDVAGHTTTVITTITLVNPAPAVRADMGVSGLNEIGFQRNVVVLTGSFSDPNGPGPYTASVRWAAAGPFTPLIINNGSGFAAAYIYGSAGVRTVTVKICDAGGACGTDDVTVRTSVTQKITPVRECVVDRGAAVNPRYLARWGYDNPAPFAIAVAAIPLIENTFTSAPYLRGQPQIFLPGQRRAVFTTTFSSGKQTWRLNGRTASAASNSPACP